MRKLFGVLGAAALGLTTVGALAPTTAAAPPPGTAPTVAVDLAPAHELPNPLEAKRRELKARAIDLMLQGDAQVEERGAARS